jgi:hypothetical protein
MAQEAKRYSLFAFLDALLITQLVSLTTLRVDYLKPFLLLQ